MAQTAPAGIITKQQFSDYVDNWTSLINDGDPADLVALFDTPETTRLSYVTFSMEQLVWLLSTVNVYYLKARFVVRTTVPLTQSKFSVVLYATDKAGTRLSAYYVANAAWPPAAPAAPTAPATATNAQGRLIPTDLAATWLHSWQHADPIVAPMFVTNYGTLEGYDFTLDDFMDPLEAAQSFSGKSLYINFGLHTYYSAADGAELLDPTQAFGLLLRVDSSAGQTSPASLSYDMATPYPPGCELGS